VFRNRRHELLHLTEVTGPIAVFEFDPLALHAGTEQFFLNLSNPVNATIADGQGVGTIVDDDGLILVTEENSQRAVALDSVFWTRDPFPIVNDLNTSSDHRTRISLFAIGLKLAAGETSSAVTATAEDSQGTIRPLEVEFVGAPHFEGFTQVVLKLNDQFTLAGDLKIRISLGVGQIAEAHIERLFEPLQCLLFFA